MTIVICQKCGAKNRVKEGAASNLQPVCGRCGGPLGAGAASGPVTVTDSNFESEVLGMRGVPVLLDCWAEWCGPCRMIAPLMDELAAESAGRYRIAKLNVDDNPGTAARFNIRTIPTMLIFRDGELRDRIVGVQPKQSILARLT